MANEIKLFPELPEDLSAVSPEELKTLLADSENAVKLIQDNDEEFLQGLSADEVIAQMEAGADAILTLREEIAAHEAAHENFKSKTAEIAARLVPKAEGEEGDGDEDGDGDEAEVVAEAEAITEEAAEEPAEAVEERELVVASAEPAKPRYSRTPVAPAPERIVVSEEPRPGTALVATGGYKEEYKGPLDPVSLAHLQKAVAEELGPMPKVDQRGKYRHAGPHGDAIFDGPRTKTAIATFEFPSDRQLDGSDADLDKIRAVMPEYVTVFGKQGELAGEALVASGGLCAPLTPIYSMPNFATEAEPVWDSLPNFRAVRGGVNVPTATYIADITTAISSISEEDDALGGTFATKSCQALECPEYTETAVQILAHCREYGNLNARAWPEKIAHENALTMAALSRTSEGFMLDRIKALSVNVTNGADTLGALIYLVDGIEKAKYGIRSRLRMPRTARFRVLLPAVVLDMLELDTIQTPFDRFRDADSLVAYLRSIGVDPVFYLDTPSTGESQIADAAQTAAALDGFPDELQWAIYPEGAFIGVDMGVLELGIVRDSTLNSTNDFQVFGERFRNVALLAPQQAAYWVTTNLCPTGQFPPAGTARTCESA